MEASLSSSIEEKIACAERYYLEVANGVVEDTLAAGLLNRLAKSIDASSREKSKAGIAEACKRCEENEGGSCCGAGLENKYDVWLLLTNLLLDAVLPRRRMDKRSCFFLGHQGCLLKARHVICVDFLCKNLQTRMDPAMIQDLRKKEGEELVTLFLLQERIKMLIRNPNG